MNSRRSRSTSADAYWNNDTIKTLPDPDDTVASGAIEKRKTVTFQVPPVHQLFELTTLPVGVLEHIFSYLDGPSVLTLRGMSPRMEAFVDEVLVGKIGRKYWLRKCFAEIPRSQVIRSLASYASTVEEYLRYTKEYKTCKDPSKTMLDEKWRHVYCSVCQLRDRCLGVLKVTRLIEVQNLLKNEVTMAFKEKVAKASYPIKMTSTTGSTLFHLRSPCTSLGDQEHLYIFENMRTYRRGLQVLGGHEKVRTVRAVNLPIPLCPSDYPDAVPPKPSVLLIITTTHHIALAPLHQGTLTRVPLQLPRMYRLFPALASENRYAIWGNKLGVWLDPDTIVIFDVRLDPVTGDVKTRVLKRVVLNQELYNAWTISDVDSKAYLPVLRLKFRNPYVTSPSDVPVFCLISPINTSYEVRFGETNAEGDTIAKVETFDPKMTPIHNVSLSLRLGRFTGSLAEQNMVVFWNESWLAVLYSGPGHVWIYQNLTTTLFSGSSAETLVHVVPQTELFFAFATNLNIYICQLNYIQPTQIFNHRLPTVCARGQIEFEVIRKISLVDILPNPWLVVTNLQYDMDHGRPYIFLACDVPALRRTAFSYELLKLEFENPGDNLDEAFAQPEDENDSVEQEQVDGDLDDAFKHLKFENEPCSF